MFLAPTVIFFAFSGALQIFRLQEAHPGSSYEPPGWMVVLAGVHKDQRIASPPGPRPPAPSSEAPQPQPKPQPASGDKPQQAKPSAILKWFFLFAATGIITTTALGIIMAFKYNRDRRVIWGLLISGTVLPIVLLYL
jgi:hypothetical protein